MLLQPLRDAGIGNRLIAPLGGRNLLADLDRLVDPATRGDPESPLRWTCKSVRKLAEELQQEVTPSVIKPWPNCFTPWTTLCQANQKTLEGSQHADRDQQFQYIRIAFNLYI